jgi:hypothetical protein
MNQHAIDLVNKQGLKFFGSVNASISHELKNIFAIISETAGFLNDLTQLSKQGKQLELSVLENCCNSISEEIERGFDTIRRMNQFAHSVDDPVRETSILDTLALAVTLTGFLSFAKKTHLDETAADTTVFTSPFLLQTLVYRTLSALYRALSAGDELTLIPAFSNPGPSGVTLVFSHGQPAGLSDFPDPQTAEVADALRAEFKKKDAGLELFIPRTNDALAAALADRQPVQKPL